KSFPAPANSVTFRTCDASASAVKRLDWFGTEFAFSDNRKVLIIMSRTSINNSDKRAQRLAMEQRSKELSSSMNERREGLQVEQAADLFDNLQMATGRDFEVQRLNLEREELSLVKKALDSLESGTYGECSDCGEEISRKRLAVMPWAVRCIA